MVEAAPLTHSKARDGLYLLRALKQNIKITQNSFFELSIVSGDQTLASHTHTDKYGNAYLN
jgi:hypothetical protein